MAKDDDGRTLVDGDRLIDKRFGFADIMRTIIIPAIIVGLGAISTISVIRNDVAHIVLAATKMEQKVDALCSKISTMAEEMAVLKTRQDERLEREAASGIRSFNRKVRNE
jgi:hypothetical protein